MQLGFMCLHVLVEFHLEVKQCQHVHVSSYPGTFILIICMQSCTYCIWVKEINLHQIEFSVFSTNKFWIPLFNRFSTNGRESMLYMYIWSHWIPHKTFLVESQIDMEVILIYLILQSLSCWCHVANSTFHWSW